MSGIFNFPDKEEWDPRYWNCTQEEFDEWVRPGLEDAQKFARWQVAVALFVLLVATFGAAVCAALSTL